jgi:hypothetical protein
VVDDHLHLLADDGQAVADLGPDRLNSPSLTSDMPSMLRKKMLRSAS